MVSGENKIENLPRTGHRKSPYTDSRGFMLLSWLGERVKYVP